MTLSIQDHVILGMSILKATYHQPTKPSECYLNKHAMRIWMEGYGVRPEVAYEAWIHIRREAASQGVQIRHLYWTFHFMKTYQSENNVARALDTNAKTLREHVKVVMKMLSRAMSKVVKWSNRKMSCLPNEKFTVTVDGTDFPIWEVRAGNNRTIDSKWYSHKFGGPGLRYEIALAIFSDHVVWVNGPFPCGSHSDLKIYKEYGLAHLLAISNEKSVADATYRHYTCSTKGKGSREWRHAKNRYRARQETFNKRLKSFNCLKETWRHSHDLHEKTVRAAIFLTQLSFGHHPLMESIDGE